MNQLFDPDGPIYYYGMKVFNVIFLNLIWLVLSIFSGGILLGFSTIGMYKGVYAGIAPNHGFSPAYFFRPLREIKKRGALLFLGSLLNYLAIVSSGVACYLIIMGYWEVIYLLPVYIIVLIESTIISFYSMPLMAHTKMNLKQVYYYAFGFANRHLLISLIGLLLILVTLFISVILPLQYVIFVALIAPSLIFATISYLVITKVFTNYDLEQFGLNIEN